MSYATRQMSTLKSVVLIGAPVFAVIPSENGLHLLVIPGKGGGDLGSVDLVYVPEPASAPLLAIGLAIGLSRIRRAKH